MDRRWLLRSGLTLTATVAAPFSIRRPAGAVSGFAFEARITEKYSGSPFYRSNFQPLIDAAAHYGVLKASFPAKEPFAPGLG